MKDCIIVFSSNVENWGAERSVCSMCEALQKKGKKVVMIIPREGLIINLLKQIDVEYLVLPYTNWTYENRSSLRIDRYIRSIIREFIHVRRIIKEIKEREFNPILVYSATILIGIGIYCSKKWKVPHVHHFRENIDAFGYKFKYGYKRSMKYINNNSNIIICTCVAVKDRYLMNLSTNKVVVINNGVPPVEKVLPKNILGTLKLVQVARFMDDKRIIDTLDAVRILANNSFTDIHLDIFGMGPEEDMYRKFIDKNNLTRFITIKGFVQNIDFSSYHIGIMASTFEAFARTTLDYMNNGLAVVASDSGGNLEQVENNITGMLFHVHDSSDMADKISKFYLDRNLIISMGNAGRRRFLQKFTQQMYQVSISSHILSLIK